MRPFVAIIAAGIVVTTASRAQELVTQNVPARTMRFNIGGERIAYLADGGCTCQAESSLPVAPDACNAVATCRASRMRTGAQLREAVDGGALER